MTPTSRIAQAMAMAVGLLFFCCFGPVAWAQMALPPETGITQRQWKKIQPHWLNEATFIDVFSQQGTSYQGLMVGAYPEGIYLLEGKNFPGGDAPLPLIFIPAEAVASFSYSHAGKVMLLAKGTFVLAAGLSVAITPALAYSPLPFLLPGAVVGGTLWVRKRAMRIKERGIQEVADRVEYALAIQGLIARNLVTTAAEAEQLRDKPGFVMPPPLTGSPFQGPTDVPGIMEVLPALKRVFLQPRITVEGSLGTRADNTWSAMNDHLAPTGREEDIRGLFSKANAQLGLYFWVHPRWSVGVEGFTQQQFHTSASYGPFELSILEALTLDVRHVFGQVSYSLVPYDRFLRRTLEVQTGIGAGVAYGRTNIILRRTGTSVDDVARNENLFTTLATKGHVTVSWFLWPQVAFTGRMDVGWSPPVGFDTVTMPVSGANQEEIVLEGGAIPIHFSQWSLGLRYHLW